MNVPLLRESFALVLDRAPDLTARFYVNFFERYPEVRPLFGSTKRHEDALARALVMLVARLDDATWVTGTLHALGSRHAGYGVTDDMYAKCGDALLVTLEQVAGEAWTPELASAWGEAFETIASLMQEGARKPRGTIHATRALQHA
jgi:hemoglobin-like flavoprotein